MTLVSEMDVAAIEKEKEKRRQIIEQKVKSLSRFVRMYQTLRHQFFASVFNSP